MGCGASAKQKAAEEAEAKEKAEELEVKKKAEEEAKKKAEELEAKRKVEELEAKQKAAELEAKRKAEEAEAKRKKEAWDAAIFAHFLQLEKDHFRDLKRELDELTEKKLVSGSSYAGVFETFLRNGSLLQTKTFQGTYEDPNYGELNIEIGPLEYDGFGGDGSGDWTYGGGYPQPCVVSRTGTTMDFKDAEDESCCRLRGTVSWHDQRTLAGYVMHDLVEVGTFRLTPVADQVYEPQKSKYYMDDDDW
mmetsp:Transcript_136760/g.236193  ORF Transcript_136760/g.236193 Transcript_136760/m.236193 type:complete len:248 (+) Transcript_136760:36-779(+)